MRHDETAYILVLTTLPSADEGRALVRRLVEDRIAACGTVLPGATSIYWWKGEVAEATEAQVLLKTRRDRWDDLQAAIRAGHPYEVPELLAIPVTAGLPAYLQWLKEATPVKGASA